MHPTRSKDSYSDSPDRRLTFIRLRCAVKPEHTYVHIDLPHKAEMHSGSTKYKYGLECAHNVAC